MKILVTGATGFIGNHVVPRLLERGHEVIAVARNEERASKQSWYHSVKFVAFDIHAPSGEAQFANFEVPDALIHLAWPGLPNYLALFHFEDNLFADYKFIKSLIALGLKHVLVAGTCFEYGMQSGCLKEDMPTCPANPYALAKDTLRKFLEALKKDNPFVIQWIRLFYMHGEGQNENSLLAQLDRAIANGDSKFNMSEGEQLRDYLPVETVADRIVDLIERADLEGIFNCCSGKPISVRELVERRVREKGSNIVLNLGYYPYPEYEPMEFWGSATKLNRAISGT